MMPAVTAVGIALGRSLVLFVQIVLFPVYGLNVALSQALATGLMFAVGRAEPWRSGFAKGGSPPGLEPSGAHASVNRRSDRRAGRRSYRTR